MTYMAKTIEWSKTEMQELRDQLQTAINCLDKIISTQANSAAYRDIAKGSLETGKPVAGGVTVICVELFLVIDAGVYNVRSAP